MHMKNSQIINIKYIFNIRNREIDIYDWFINI